MDQQQTEIVQQDEQKTKRNKGTIIAVIILILLVLGAGGYYAYTKLFKKAGESITDTVASKVAESECKYNDKDICKFIANWKEAKYITMSGTTTDKDGKVSTILMKIEGDTKSQMTSGENGKEVYNTITIDKTTYTKDYSDNKWFKSTFSSESDIADNYLKEDASFDEKESSSEDKTTYEKIGKESCGKYTCFKYKVVDPTSTGTTEYIYFDDKEYQLRKMRTEDKDGSITEINYDYTKFTISEPSPTKEGDPLGSTSTYNADSTTDSGITSDTSSDYDSSVYDSGSDVSSTDYDSSE